MSLGLYVFIGASIGFLLGVFVGDWLFRHRAADLTTRSSFRRHKSLIKRLRRITGKNYRHISRTAYVHDVPENGQRLRSNQIFFGRSFDL